MHHNVVDNIVEGLKKNSVSIFITGSHARGEATSNSDIDILVVTKSDHSFEEMIVDGVVVEIKRNTIEGFKEKIAKDPMNTYQWLDAKPLYDPENLMEDLHNFAYNAIANYHPVAFPRKWLESAKVKIESAQEAKNGLLLGFHVSNILWKVVEGLYIINSLPTPPSSTAFKRLYGLKVLPENFNYVWTNTLTGDLEERTTATLTLIEFLLEQQL